MGADFSKQLDDLPGAAFCMNSSRKADPEHWHLFEAKMRSEGLSDAAIAAFKHNYAKLASGADLMIPEWTISSVTSLPSYDSLTAEDPSLLSKTVMLKLNGGLGTGMGLEKAKSLLMLKDKKTFLDFIAKQVLHMRKSYGVELAFMLMNSFSTSADTLKALGKYKGKEQLESNGLPLEFQQNKAPKVDAADLTPALWPAQPAHEWCPPGHGDVYPALIGSGTLDALLEKGFKYVSAAGLSTEPLDRAAGQSRWTEPLDRTAGQSRWTEPLDRAAGQSRWTEPLDRTAGQNRWTEPLDRAAGQSRLIEPPSRSQSRPPSRTSHARLCALPTQVHVRLQLGQPRRDDGPQAAHVVRHERRALRDGVRRAHRRRQEGWPPREAARWPAAARECAVSRRRRGQVPRRQPPQGPALRALIASDCL